MSPPMAVIRLNSRALLPGPQITASASVGSPRRAQ